MKRIVLYIASAICCFAFMACNGDKNEIMKSAYGYLNAMGNYRIEEATAYATEETREITLKYIIESIMPITDTNYIKSNTPANIEIVKVDFKSDSVAMVTYSKHTPIKKQDGTLEMRKRGEQWLAHVIITNKVVPTKAEQDMMKNIGDSLQHQFKKGDLKIVKPDSLHKVRINK